MVFGLVWTISPHDVQARDHREESVCTDSIDDFWTLRQRVHLVNVFCVPTFVVLMVFKLVTERVAAPTRPQSTLLYQSVHLAGVCQQAMVVSLARLTQPLMAVRPLPMPA